MITDRRYWLDGKIPVLLYIWLDQMAQVVNIPPANAGAKGLIPEDPPGNIPWRRKWQPTAVFLPGESHGQSSLVGYSTWGHKESDTTEVAEHIRRAGFLHFWTWIILCSQVGGGSSPHWTQHSAASLVSNHYMPVTTRSCDNQKYPQGIPWMSTD